MALGAAPSVGVPQVEVAPLVAEEDPPVVGALAAARQAAAVLVESGSIV